MKHKEKCTESKASISGLRKNCTKCKYVSNDAITLKRHMCDEHNITTNSISPPHKKLKKSKSDISEESMEIESRGVVDLSESFEEYYGTTKDKKRVCLLDEQAEKDLTPNDTNEFDFFLFGGILGNVDEQDADAADEISALGMDVHVVPTVMQSTEDRKELARATLRFAETLHGKVPR